MKRPLVAWAVALVAGIALGGRFPGTWPSIAIGAVALAAIAVRVRTGRGPTTGFIVAVALLAVFGAWRIAPYREAPTWPAIPEENRRGVRATFEGTVVRYPAIFPDRARLVLGDLRFDDGLPTPPADARLLLTVRGTRAVPRYGDRVRVAATVRAPTGYRNPGGFDYAARLRDQGIAATAWVGPKTAIATTATGRGSSVLRTVGRARDAVRAHLDARYFVPEKEIVKALVIGDQEEIPEELREAYRVTGIAHILSISGFHVAVVAAIAYLVAWALVTRFPRLLLRASARKLAAAASLPPVAFYVLLAGANLPTVRAGIMVSVFVLAVLTDRAGDAPSAIALAALAVLAVDPPALFDVSFQLSFGAVIAIFAALARLDRWRRERGAASWRFRDGATAYLLVGVAANLSTMPITAYHFHRISLAGLVANPVLVPVIGNLATPLVLLAGAALPLSEFVARALFTVALVVLRGADAVVACFASWSWASIYVPDPRGWEVAAIFAGIAALLIVPRRRTAWLVAATCAIVVAVSVVATEIAERPRDIRATFLDVGQGDAALIEFPGPPVRRVLVDGGGVQRGTFDVGKSVVAPYLWHRRIRRLDAVVLTHPHPDHFDGLRFVCRRFEVGELWDAGESSPDPRYADLLATLRERGIPRRIVDDSFRPPRGMETLRVIFPASGDGVDGAASLNDRSLVLAIDDPRMPLLLPGDAATALEARIAKNSILPTRGVFKVGHHGQRDAASAALLGALRPRIAVIACGRYNAWGAPSTETLARLATAGATVVRTDRVGSIEIVPAADGSLRVATGTGASFRVP